MSHDLAAPYSENRLAWLRQEVDLAKERVDALADTPANDAWAEADRGRAALELADAEDQLADALGGGALRVRLAGRTIHGHAIQASALTSVVSPIQGLAQDFGGELYFGQTRAGSYVITLLPHPQLQLLEASPLENVGEVIAALVDASSVHDPDATVEEIASELSLEAVRSLTALTRSLVDNGLSAMITWSAPDGSKKQRNLPVQGSNRLLLALNHAQVEREQSEIEGELVLADISRRPRFAIRLDDGTELRGSVPPTVARTQVRGLAVGDRVRARLELVRRQRSATPTVVYRLLRVEATSSVG